MEALLYEFSDWAQATALALGYQVLWILTGLENWSQWNRVHAYYTGVKISEEEVFAAEQRAQAFVDDRVPDKDAKNLDEVEDLLARCDPRVLNGSIAAAIQAEMGGWVDFLDPKTGKANWVIVGQKINKRLQGVKNLRNAHRFRNHRLKTIRMLVGSPDPVDLLEQRVLRYRSSWLTRLINLWNGRNVVLPSDTAASIRELESIKEPVLRTSWEFLQDVIAS